MAQAGHLWLYFLMVFGVIVLPGMDMAFVLASALSGGGRAGAFAVAGIVFGGLCHTAAGALGFGLVFKLVPGLINAMLAIGALYIAWIGCSLLRAQPAAEAVATESLPLPASPAAMAALPPWVTFRRAALTCLMNPKAYLFMFAIFPQFLRVEYGPVWMQALALAAITAATQIAVYGGLAFAAGSAQNWLGARPRVGIWLTRGAGAMLLVGAAITVLGVVWPSA